METENIYRDIGQNIRRFREGARRTQAQLAAQIGISRASLANIEAGRQQILAHYLYAIADALDLNSPIVLMPMPKPTALDNAEPSTLPLPEEGLSEKQRREVLYLMGGGPNNKDDENLREDT